MLVVVVLLVSAGGHPALLEAGVVASEAGRPTTTVHPHTVHALQHRIVKLLATAPEELTARQVKKLNIIMPYVSLNFDLYWKICYLFYDVKEYAETEIYLGLPGSNGSALFSKYCSQVQI